MDLTFADLKKNLTNLNDCTSAIKVAILGDSTTSFFATAIKGYGVEFGIKIDLFESEYNQIEQLIMNNKSKLYDFDPDFTIIFQSSIKLLNRYHVDYEYNSIIQDRIDFIQVICDRIKKNIIYFNYTEIDDMIYGNYSNNIDKSFIYQIRKLNYELMNLAQNHNNLFICDISSLQNKYGKNFAYSPQLYISSDIVFTLDFIVLIAGKVLNIINTIRGNLKKCLILDLDNTLWGGVIGDDGVEGIQLGNDLGVGKAYVEFQSWIKKLQLRGIIIAICSKNDEDIAKLPFLNHPSMILKLEDISVFIANWENKAKNIKYIRDILNIDYNSMVFIDDNPMERDIVRQNLPDVTVPDLPKDPSEYLEFLYGLNLFETSSYSENDISRTKQYRDEAERLKSKKKFVDENSFLRSINMKAEVSDLNSFNLPRIAQLSQRTNQFNLTTIRYTENDLKNIMNNNRYISFCVSLNDNYGSYGLISSIILSKYNKSTLFIESWFMSCRVIKRGVENFLMSKLVYHSIKKGFTKILGKYIPTSKNKIVEDHYKNLGFKILKKDDEVFYELDVIDYKEKDFFITT